MSTKKVRRGRGGEGVKGMHLVFLRFSKDGETDWQFTQFCEEKLKRVPANHQAKG